MIGFSRNEALSNSDSISIMNSAVSDFTAQEMTREEYTRKALCSKSTADCDVTWESRLLASFQHVRNAASFKATLQRHSSTVSQIRAKNFLPLSEQGTRGQRPHSAVTRAWGEEIAPFVGHEPQIRVMPGFPMLQLCCRIRQFTSARFSRRKMVMLRITGWPQKVIDAFIF